LRIGTAEAWYRLQLSLPNDTAGVRSAKLLADSLLASGRGNGKVDLMGLAGLAALTGHGFLAARLYREASVAGQTVLPWPIIAEPATALLTYSSLGGPSDSVLHLRRQLEEAIERSLPPGERQPARLSWVDRSATLAIPNLPAEVARGFGGSGYPLLEAMVAEARGDRQRISGLFERLREVRRPLAPEDVSIDALFPEAWLLARIGRDTDAAAWLDPWFRALPRVTPGGLGLIPESAALVRAMALRANLAQRLGDGAAAAAWGRAFGVLWSDADPYLRKTVVEMNGLVQEARRTTRN
jgi:hypothetical protein